MATKEKSTAQEITGNDSNLPEAIQAADSVEALLNEDSSVSKPMYDLRISEDGVSLLLDCRDPHGGLEATAARIDEDLVKMELPECPDLKTLLKILQKSCQPGEHLVGYPIIRGWLPTPGQDGRLERGRDYFAESWTDEDDTEVVDLWDQNDQRAVQKDEILARVHRPIPGEPGLDVYCREIPVPKPESVKLRPGKGVTTVDEGEWIDYYAETAGRIRYQDGTIFVDDVYVIKGDVSLETGNISHTGAVQVEGDVKTGATIEADGDISVKGMLEPCHIKCGGSLTVGAASWGWKNFKSRPMKTCRPCTSVGPWCAQVATLRSPTKSPKRI